MTAIKLVSETEDTVTLRRADFDALLEELEDTEDRLAVQRYHRRAERLGAHPQNYLTTDEMVRIADGESPIAIWREKRGLTQRRLAEVADISQSLLAEIETGAKAGSVDTLRRLAEALRLDMDDLLA